MEHSGRKRRKRAWLWAVGISTILLITFLVPRSWLFIEDPTDGHLHDDVGPRLSWTCPMLCVVLDSPGLCPVCGMDLEPIELSGDEVVLSTRDQEMIGLTVAEISRRELSSEFTLPGRIGYDLSELYTVTAWTGGRIDRLMVSQSGEVVNEGQVLAEIYSPELYTAKQELLVFAVPGDPQGDRVQLAREKLRLMGMSEYSIDALISRGYANTASPVISPASGTVTSLSVVEGQYLSEGSVMMELADMSTVWLTAYVTEDLTAEVHVGQEVGFRLDSRPGASYSGVVSYTEPFLAGSGANGEVRILLQNPGGEFLPGESVSVTFFSSDPVDPELTVPRSSVLRLGRRSVAYLLTGPISYVPTEDGRMRIEEARFRPVEIVHGPLSSDSTGALYYPVYQGLSEGDIVALHGAFLIDSQAELLGLPSLLSGDRSAPSEP